MRRNAARAKTTIAVTKKEVEQIRAEEAAAGVPEEFRTPGSVSPKARVIPKDQRRQYPPEAFEDGNTKVKISMYVDLDILNHFKARAAESGAPYQTQINAELRRIMEQETAGDPASVTQKLKQARTLIAAVERSIRRNGEVIE